MKTHPLIPRTGQHADYYAATDRKHFGDAGTPGSKFTDPTIRNLEDLLELAERQRGHLDGDDRAILIRDCRADPNAFLDGFRYLIVAVDGVLGIMHTKHLNSTDTAAIIRTKPDAPCSIVVNVTIPLNTSVGTIIIGRDDDGTERVITAHPDVPIRPAASDILDQWEGETVDIATVRELMGGDLWVNATVN